MKFVLGAAGRGGHWPLAIVLVLALSSEATGQVPPSTPMAKATPRSSSVRNPEDAPPSISEVQRANYQAPTIGPRQPPAVMRQSEAAPNLFPAPPTHTHAQGYSPRSAQRPGAMRNGYYDQAPGSAAPRPHERPYDVRPTGHMMYQGEPEMVEPGTPTPDYTQDGQFLPEAAPGFPGRYDELGYGGCADCCESCYQCGPPLWHYLYPFINCGGCCYPGWLLENFSIQGGFHGFKGPPDLGSNGNFGLHTGFNWGIPIWQPWSIGFQFGYQALFSNFEGNTIFGTYLEESRRQNVVTTGFFHRPMCSPWQWGVVADWMKDEYYVDMSLSQIRFELSFLGPQNNELGFTSSLGTGHDTKPFLLAVDNQVIVNQTEYWEPIDLYAFFWRHRFCMGAEWRIWAGFSGGGDGLFGSDYRVPISSWLALQGAANYLSAKQSGIEGVAEESWGLMINLVIYPGRTAEVSTRSLWRPLFNVADPTNFMVDRHVVAP